MKTKENKVNRILSAVLLIIIGMILGGILFLFNQKKAIIQIMKENESMYSKFTAVDTLLKSEYFEEGALSGHFDEMIENALVGYVNGLDDPHTMYLKKEQNSELNQELHNESGFAGIGVVIQKNDEYAIVDEVLKGSAAAKAGLQPLDKIYAIDEHVVANLTSEETVGYIRGDKGSTVNLFIVRDSKVGTGLTGTIKTWVSVVRDDVNIPSVSSEIIEKDGKRILYLEISIISSKTSSLMVDEIYDATRNGENIDGIIFDLRGNNGGYLEEAVKILGHFVPKGEVVLKTKYRTFEDMEYKSEGKGELGNYPLVILVDQNTASAGEIIALTLQENGKKIIGVNSFGKGTIQTLETFVDGSSLKYTVGKWYSPSEVNVDLEGITPDVIIERDSDKYLMEGIDVQLQKAEEEIMNMI